MRAQLRFILPAVLSLAPLGAQSSDFQALLSVAQTTWPEKQHIGVVCNYEASKDQIAELAGSAAFGSRITVVDARTALDLNAATAILQHRKADFVVLLPNDPIFFEGSFQASLLVARMAWRGTPSVGTSPLALRQGAVFSIGARTGNQLLVTNRLQGTVSVLLPSRMAAISAGSPLAIRTASGVTVDVTTLP